TYNRCSQTVTDREEVDRDHRSPLSTEEFPPGRTAAGLRPAESRCAKNLAHGRRRHGDREPFQFGSDPLVASPGILLCEPNDEFPNIASDEGRPGRSPYVQRLVMSRRCQCRGVAGVTMKDRHIARGTSRLAAARHMRSDVVMVGRRFADARWRVRGRSTTIS